MKQTSSLRVFLAATLVASSIMAMKIVMPSTPLGATVVAATLGLVLIFAMFRSDARRRRELAVQTDGATVRASHDLDPDAIRRRLENRPVPQVSPGPLSRDMASPAESGIAATPPSHGGHAAPDGDPPFARPAAPVLELVQPVAEPEAQAEDENSFEPALELSEAAEWIDRPFEDLDDDFSWDGFTDAPTPLGEQAVPETAATPNPVEVAETSFDRDGLTHEPATDQDRSDFSGSSIIEESEATEEFAHPEPEVFETVDNAVSANSEIKADAVHAPAPAQSPTITTCADPIETARTNPLVLAETFPPTPDAGLSFYGGLPVGPSDLAWPHATAGEREIALTFIMQWECAKLARHDATGMLPRDGALYLFMDLDWSRPMAYRFVHAGGPTEGWSEIAPPEDLGPAYGSQAIWAWPMCAGPDHDARGIVPSILPQWSFTPSRLELATSDSPFWQKDASLAAALAAIDGTVPAGIDDGLARPYASFPHDWSAVRIACAYLLDLMRQPNQPAEVTQWLDETRMLYAVASREEPFEAIPQVSADEMWGWMQMVRAGLEPAFANLVTAAINATLGARGEAMGSIPAEAIAAVASTHKLAPRPAPNRIFGAPSWVQGHVGPFVESEVLLLELGGNETLGHFFGTGVLQFTIAPEDLAAGKFDRVRMTVSAS